MKTPVRCTHFDPPASKCVHFAKLHDTRLAPPACSTAPERPRMGTGPAQRQPYGPGGHVPRMQASNPPAGGSMARPPKWDSRVPATLVPDGAAPRTQESHPSTLGGLGAHIERLDSRVPLDATPCDPTATMRDPSTATTRAPSVSGVIGWVLAARRAPPNVGACTSGRWPSMTAGRHPLGAHCDDEWPQHAVHARAERARRDRVGLGTT